MKRITLLQTISDLTLCFPDHLLDNIPHSLAITIRKELAVLMGRNMYYRIRNQERLLHPDEQEQITKIFLKHVVSAENRNLNSINTLINTIGKLPIGEP